MSVYSDKLSSISEYGAGSTRTSLTALSMYGGAHSQSPGGGSLSTLASASTTRSYRPNGLPGERKPGESSNQIMTQRISGRGGGKHNYELCKKVRVSMALIGILVLVAAIFMLSFYLPKQYQTQERKLPVEKKEEPLWDSMIFMNKNPHNLHFTFARNVTSALQNPAEIALKANMGILLSESARNNHSIKETNASLEMIFYDKDTGPITLNVTKDSYYPQCFEIHWSATYNSKLKDCFDTISSHWYGLGEAFDQRWPLDKATFPMTPFLTSDFIDEYSSSIFGGILEPFAINSKGAGIYIADHVPLHVSMNEGEKKMCLQADPNTEYNRMYKVVLPNATNDLQYTICIEENIKEVHKLMFDRFIEKPTETPDLEVMKKPIWSTWVRNKKAVNQSIIDKLTEEIEKYGFDVSHIQIEGQYSTEYGDFNFDGKKFPQVSNMLTYLKTRGYRVTLSVYPFTNLKSKNFLKTLDYGVKVGLKNIPGIAHWWNGFASILDTTDPASRQWFIKRLQDFQKLEISGFKFDTGETNYLPNDFKFKKPVPNPNYYTQGYVEIASHFKLSEVRVGYKSQKFPTFVRMLDRTSYWKTQNGLQSVLTACLTFGILGYPYIVPDMVGGNGYYLRPSKELFVRWTQLSIFLPTIQFSITPWDYDGDEVLNIVRDALEVRKNLTDIMVDAAKMFPVTGEPIIRPLWWYWPNDHYAFVADTEFMLADKYLIAPVMHLNIISHAIYVPPGLWEEQWGNREILNMTTGQVLHYNVTLQDICYFKLLSNITLY